MTTSLLPGQHIAVSRGLYSHHGIYSGFSDGKPWVTELAKPADGGTVRTIPFGTFTGGGSVQVIYHPDGVPLEQAIRNSRRVPSNRKYDLLSWNCEHFANWCATHQAKSGQIEGLSAFALLAVGLWFLG